MQANFCKIEAYKYNNFLAFGLNQYRVWSNRLSKGEYISLFRGVNLKKLVSLYFETLCLWKVLKTPKIIAS